MRFKTDENLPADSAEILRLAGHDALTVHDQLIDGEPDELIIDVCGKEKRIFVTLDMDFSDVRSYPPREYPGLIVLRLRSQDKPHVLDAIKRLISLLEREEINRRLWIVEEDRLRIRGEDN